MKQAPFLDDAYKIIDANFNRVKEGLRVCEDIARFHLKSPKDTSALARLRHDLTLTIKESAILPEKLLRARDIAADPGKTSVLGPARKTYRAIFSANAQRVKEALRVLEEFSKLFDPKASGRLQRLRFKFYGYEKKVFSRFPDLFDPR